MKQNLHYPEIRIITHQIILISWNSDEFEKIAPMILDLSNDIKNKLSEVLIDVVPCYESISLYFKNDYSAFDLMRLNKMLCDRSYESNFPKYRLRIPVCFDEKYATDLKYMSSQVNIPTEDIVTEFCSSTYIVAFLGFLPGFPYLNGLSQKLAIPRKSSPRSRIAPGSVGIAGKQAGIYPQESPGGWNIIGNCPLTLFNSMQAPYALFQPGDYVEFFKVDEKTYEKIASEKTDLFNLRKMLLQSV